MDFDEELELVFTRTEMIYSFYQDSILGYYNDLKNRLLKTNRWDQRVEISPLSQIYTHKLHQYKDWWTKEEWEKDIKNYYRNNTDGDWIFEYQATYEKSFYVTKREKAKFKTGDEYYYEKELIQENKSKVIYLVHKGKSKTKDIFLINEYIKLLNNNNVGWFCIDYDTKF